MTWEKFLQRTDFNAERYTSYNRSARPERHASVADVLFLCGSWASCDTIFALSHFNTKVIPRSPLVANIFFQRAPTVLRSIHQIDYFFLS